jgi:hypothetical protein
MSEVEKMCDKFKFLASHSRWNFESKMNLLACKWRDWHGCRIVDSASILLKKASSNVSWRWLVNWKGTSTKNKVRRGKRLYCSSSLVMHISAFDNSGQSRSK